MVSASGLFHPSVSVKDVSSRPNRTMGDWQTRMKKCLHPFQTYDNILLAVAKIVVIDKMHVMRYNK